MKKETLNFKYVLSITLISAMGGLLFGYDWVVVGGAKPFYEEYFHLTEASQIGWAMSAALVGALVGALGSGAISDLLGRKKILLSAAFLFVVTAIGTGLSDTFTSFVLFRIFGGVAIGMASSLSPMYIAEVAPASKRGMLVSINQLTIVIGLLMAQLVNLLIAEPVPEQYGPDYILNSWNGQVGWRWMFAAASFPACLFFVLAFLIPESPRWLVKVKRDQEAEKVLKKIGGKEYAESILKEIKESLKGENGRVRLGDLRERKILKILFLGVFIAVFSQWTGINTIFYYAEEVFSAAGFGLSSIMVNIVITGSVMLVFTFVAIRLVDRTGRRKLFLIGAAGLAIIYLLMGAGFFFHMEGVLIMLLVVLALTIYSFTIAPITWVLISEIFPNRVRGAAMSIAVFSLWTGNFALTYAFPHLNEGLGTAGVFWLYAGICAVSFVFLSFKLPETKGRTLEEIESVITGE